MATQVRQAGSPVRDPKLAHVGGGVYVYIGGGDGLTNFGLVLTDDRPVLIDADMRVRKWFRRCMRRVTPKEPGLVLNTHHNFDHTSDNGYYAKRGAITLGADLIRQEMERELAEGTWSRALTRSGFQLAHLAGEIDFAPPMATFETEIRIRYGGRLFEMIYIGHCHTKGDTVVWMPEEKILFAGDLLANRSHPATQQGNFANWKRALPRLAKFPARYFIPGHGPLPRGGSGIVEENRLYFARLHRRAAAALDREGEPEKAARLVKMPEYARWTRGHNRPANALKMAKDLSAGLIP